MKKATKNTEIKKKPGILVQTAQAKLRALRLYQIKIRGKSNSASKTNFHQNRCSFATAKLRALRPHQIKVRDQAKSASKTNFHKKSL